MTGSQGWLLRREEQVWLPSCLSEFLLSGGWPSPASGVKRASGSWTFSLEQELWSPVLSGDTQAWVHCPSGGKEDSAGVPDFSDVLSCLPCGCLPRCLTVRHHTHFFASCSLPSIPDVCTHWGGRRWTAKRSFRCSGQGAERQSGRGRWGERQGDRGLCEIQRGTQSVAKHGQCVGAVARTFLPVRKFLLSALLSGVN